jgi:hypothetical protein
MKVKVITIGNSQGVILNKRLLGNLVGKEVEIEVKGLPKSRKENVITPANVPTFPLELPLENVKTEADVKTNSNLISVETAKTEIPVESKPKEWRTTPVEQLNSPEMKRIWEANVTGQGGPEWPGDTEPFVPAKKPEPESS